MSDEAYLQYYRCVSRLPPVSFYNITGLCVPCVYMYDVERSHGQIAGLNSSLGGLILGQRF
jgi:hypothetical protein